MDRIRIGDIVRINTKDLHWWDIQVPKMYWHDYDWVVVSLPGSWVKIQRTDMDETRNRHGWYTYNVRRKHLELVYGNDADVRLAVNDGVF